MRYLSDNERHNGIPPESGGIEEQPYDWKLLLDLAYAALDHAREDIREDEERKRLQEEQDMASRIGDEEELELY